MIKIMSILGILCMAMMVSSNQTDTENALYDDSSSSENVGKNLVAEQKTTDPFFLNSAGITV